jgi:hypothetical protein
MLISKGAIAFVLGSAFVSSAIVYQGIANRHQAVAASSVLQAQEQPANPKPPAGTPVASDTPTDQANDLNAPQSNNPSADQNAPEKQDASSDQTPSADPNQATASNGSGDSTVAGDSDSGAQVAVIRRQPVAASRATRVVRIQKAAVQPTVSTSPAAPMVATAYAPPALIAPATIVLPAGTPLTIRLNEALGSSSSQPDQAFSASLDRNITANGKTVIPAGALVNGQVVAARPAGALAGEANLQLQITSLSLDDHQIQFKSAIHSFGPTIHGKSKFGRFMKGLAKRAVGKEKEVELDDQTAYTFFLLGPLSLQ